MREVAPPDRVPGPVTDPAPNMTGAGARADRGRLWARQRRLVWACLLVGLHAGAAMLLWRTESIALGMAAFVLAWGMLNAVLLGLLRRPILAGAVSLALIGALVALSRFKHGVVLMTVVFVDVMVLDWDTMRFALTVLPWARLLVVLGMIAAAGLAVALWRLEPWRVGRRWSLATATACLPALVGLSLNHPAEPWEVFYNGDYVSKFFRSGVEQVAVLARRGLLESDPAASGPVDRLQPAAPCQPARKLPHILLIHDESSFDIRVLPGIKVPPGYGAHFRSLDEKVRSLRVESSGGGSWFAEYNVLTGLSARSFGEFSYFLTRIAAGRVERGLPRALVACGYQTFSLYPSPGGFMGAAKFHTSTGIQHVFDHAVLGGALVEPDNFYYAAAQRLIAGRHQQGPLFAYIYLSANHFPWSSDGQNERDPGLAWTPPGNEAMLDDYLRRQALSALHYGQFRDALQRQFPNEPFLIVRYGDHQPSFAGERLAAGLDLAAWSRAMLRFDPKFFSTYYAIDALGFAPADLSAAMPELDAAYLPLTILTAAGVPLDPSFAEQRRILERCRGVFYGCRDGAEARRFNRLLIDAGSIKRL